VTAAGSVNIPLMLRDHLPIAARSLKAEIDALELELTAKRADLLQHQQVALVVGVDLNAPIKATETKTALSMGSDAVTSSVADDAGAAPRTKE
jgi:hypothetical protein